MKFIILLIGSILSVAVAGENWPQFRGSSGDGRSDSVGLPTSFSENQNVKWKTAIHGKGWSSPVIWGEQIWLTTASEDGKQLGVICLDKEQGKILHDIKLWDVAEPQFCHKFNSYASPTPVIEEGRLYVSFGSPGIGCLDTHTGKLLWERRDFVCNHFRGAGSSPIVWKNLLIIPFDGSDHQFIAALDKMTGKTIWQINRSIDFQDIQPDGKPEADGDWRKGFGTAHVTDWEGHPLLLSSGAKAHYAYDPSTGAEIFRYEFRDSHSPASRPVVGHGLWFLTTGFGKKHLFALRLGKKGLLDDEAIAWRETKGAPNKPSLILDGNWLYMSDDTGIASCLDAKSGAMQWRERIGGDYSASPILADGKLYFLSENGRVTVLAATPKFTKLGEGKFDEGFMASPAVSGKALFIRSRAALYCIEQ